MSGELPLFSTQASWEKCLPYSDISLLTFFDVGLGGGSTGSGVLTSSVLGKGILSLKL